jgi:hypothetical protein
MNIRLPRFSTLWLLPAVCLLAGCHHALSDVTGVWHGPDGGVFMFNPDKTFSRGSEDMKTTGTWSLDGSRVSVVIDRVGDKSFDDYFAELTKSRFATSTADERAEAKTRLKNIAFSISDDAQSMTTIVGPGENSVVLTRNAPPPKMDKS